MSDPLLKKRTAPWRKAEARPRSTVPGRHPKAKKGVTIEEIERALTASGGLISDAARILGIDRSTLDARVKRSERLTAHQKQVYEDFIDFCESKLMQAVKKGNLGAVCFVLRTKGRHRGYVERQELESTTTEPVRVYIPKKDDPPPPAEYVEPPTIDDGTVTPDVPAEEKKATEPKD